MKIRKSEKGNIVVGSIIIVGIILIILMFIITVFMENINSILYGIKTDMYIINKAAVLSVNKNKANVDNYTYNEKEYKKEFLNLLKRNYELNDDLKSNDGIISKIEIKEYKLYKKGQKDSYSKQKCDDVVIHTVLKVNVRPIILKDALEDVFVFTVHEDVNLNMVKTKR